MKKSIFLIICVLSRVKRVIKEINDLKINKKTV